MIRFFLSNDAQAAHHLHASCFPDPWPVNAFTDLLATGAFGFVAIQDTFLIGLILLRSAADEAEILTFAVHPDYRRQKIGMDLLAHSIVNLDNSVVTRLLLEVAEDNEPALSLYRKMEFEQIGERSAYYRDKTSVKTALLMERVFNVAK